MRNSLPSAAKRVLVILHELTMMGKFDQDQLRREIVATLLRSMWPSHSCVDRNDKVVSHRTFPALTYRLHRFTRAYIVRTDIVYSPRAVAKIKETGQ